MPFTRLFFTQFGRIDRGQGCMDSIEQVLGTVGSKLSKWRKKNSLRSPALPHLQTNQLVISLHGQVNYIPSRGDRMALRLRLFYLLSTL